MEWLLRLILLLVGALIITGIVWAYRRHKSEQELDLGRAARMDEEPPDPIDLDVGKARVVTNPNHPDNPPSRAEPSINGDEQPHAPDAQPLADGPKLDQSAATEQEQWVDGPPAEEPTATNGRGARERLASWLGGPAEDKPTHHNSEPGEAELGEQTAHTSAPQATTAGRMAAERARAEDREHEGGLLKQRFGKHFTRAAQTEPPPTKTQTRSEPANAAKTEPQSASSPAQTTQTETKPAVNEIVLSLFVVERKQQPMQAARLQALIEEMGFEFGAYSIYHFYDLAGNTWLSLMNAVDPGTFDPQDTQSFATPALALFMRVPGSTGNPEIVFDRLVGIANEIASELNAVVLDDQQQPLDAAGIDRYRDLIHTRT